MRIDSVGNLLVGTTLNNGYRTHINAGNTQCAVLDALAISNINNGAATGTGVRMLFKLSAFESAVENRKFAAIDAVGTAANNAAIALRFFTQTNAAGGDPAERMRIDSNGDVRAFRQIGSQGTNGFGVFRAGGSVTLADGATIQLSGGSSAQIICIGCGSTGTGAAFFANFNTTVTQIGGSTTSVSVSDSGTVDIAVYKSTNSNNVFFKNRSGSSRNYAIAMFCGSNGGLV
jgi:hypothetical protein